jgi:hypothetical protein
MFVATVMLLLHVIVTNTHPLRLSLIRLNLLLLVSDLFGWKLASRHLN